MRGGLHSIALEVSGGAREGQPFTFAATRDGGYGEEAYAIVTIRDSAIIDSAIIDPDLQNMPKVFLRRVDFAAGQRQDDGVARTTATFTPQGDDAADPDGERRLTLSVGTTEVGSFAPACVFVGASETCTQWYDTPEGEDGSPVTFAVAVADTGLAAGTPSLAVRDAYGGGVQEPSQEQVDSGTDAPLSFHVVLSKTSASAVTVDYATRDGTATARADYAPASGTLTFEPGETVKTVEVRVLPDSHDEGSETLSLVLSNASGAAIGDAEGIGTISNTGPIPRAWIARFGRTVAEQMLEAVEGRMRATPAPGVEIAFRRPANRGRIGVPRIGFPRIGVRGRRGRRQRGGTGGTARCAAPDRLAEQRDRWRGAVPVPRGDVARPVDRLLLHAHGGDAR